MVSEVWRARVSEGGCKPNSSSIVSLISETRSSGMNPARCRGRWWSSKTFSTRLRSKTVHGQASLGVWACRRAASFSATLCAPEPVWREIVTARRGTPPLAAAGVLPADCKWALMNVRHRSKHSVFIMLCGFHAQLQFFRPDILVLRLYPNITHTAGKVYPIRPAQFGRACYGSLREPAGLSPSRRDLRGIIVWGAVPPNPLPCTLCACPFPRQVVYKVFSPEQTEGGY